MRSGASSIEQRPDMRICVVQRISDGTKECKGDGCQRKSAAVKKECRTSGSQTDMTIRQKTKQLAYEPFKQCNMHPTSCMFFIVVFSDRDSGSSDTYYCMPEVFHKVVDLPHGCVSRPSVLAGKLQRVQNFPACLVVCAPPLGCSHHSNTQTSQ